MVEFLGRLIHSHWLILSRSHSFRHLTLPRRTLQARRGGRRWAVAPPLWFSGWQSHVSSPPGHRGGRHSHRGRTRHILTRLRPSSPKRRSSFCLKGDGSVGIRSNDISQLISLRTWGCRLFSTKLIKD